MAASEPRAVSACYDRASGRVALNLTSGCTFIFPTDLIEDLKDAIASDLDRIEVDGAGFNLHWPALDVDLYVPALVAGVFGTRRWMQSAMARSAGHATSPRKAAAARANGTKGGRPRKKA